MIKTLLKRRALVLTACSAVAAFATTAAGQVPAARDDRWHHHSAFGWALTGYGSYMLDGAEEGQIFGARFVCTPIRQSRAAFDVAFGGDGGMVTSAADRYFLGTAYGDTRMYIQLWKPFWVQCGAGLVWMGELRPEGVAIAEKYNVGTSYFFGPSFQLSPAWGVVPEWRWDNVPYGTTPALRGYHQSWRIAVYVN